jgi:hypothetical protein
MPSLVSLNQFFAWVHVILGGLTLATSLCLGVLLAIQGYDPHTFILMTVIVLALYGFSVLGFAFQFLYKRKGLAFNTWAQWTYMIWHLHPFALLLIHR